MVKRFLLLIFIISAFGIMPSVSAQTATASAASECDLAGLQKLIDIYIETLQTVKTKETDPATILNDLQLLANIAASQRSICDGLTFSGKKQLVVGPVNIPAGVYRAVATSTGPLIVNLTITDGECENRNVGEEKGLFALQKGEADEGAEAVFTSKGCTVLIEVSLVRADWKLSFEPIASD